MGLPSTFEKAQAEIEANIHFHILESECIQLGLFPGNRIYEKASFQAREPGHRNHTIMPASKASLISTQFLTHRLMMLMKLEAGDMSNLLMIN
jgi:hypothetical protein